MITKFIRIGTETFASKKGASSYFYHNDHLGGVNVISTQAGTKCQLNEYDPWGAVSRSEGATPGSPATCDTTHRFTGQELDPETGLYYFGGRYYDQEITRFISPDPYVQEPDDPQNLNRYTYVLNSPMNYTDPSGFFWWLIPSIVEFIQTASAALGELATASLAAEQTGNALIAAQAAELSASQTVAALAKACAAECSPASQGLLKAAESALESAQAGVKAAEVARSAALSTFQKTFVQSAIKVGASGVSLTKDIVTEVAKLRGAAKGGGGGLQEQMMKNITQKTGSMSKMGAEPRGGTYVLRDRQTQQVMRCGQTNCLDRRAGEHARDARTRGLNFEPVDRTDSYPARRGLEQQLHERHNPPLDRQNGISPRNPKGPEYRRAAEEFLQSQK